QRRRVGRRLDRDRTKHGIPGRYLKDRVRRRIDARSDTSKAVWKLTAAPVPWCVARCDQSLGRERTPSTAGQLVMARGRNDWPATFSIAPNHRKTLAMTTVPPFRPQPTVARKSFARRRNA